MTWLFFILLSVGFASISSILQKILMKNEKSDTVSYAIMFQFIFGTFNLLFGLWHGFVFPEISLNLFFFLLAGLLWGFGTMFLFKAYQKLEASEVVILTSTRSLITVVAALIFLNESYTINNVIGTILILLSIVLVTKLKKGIKLNRGVMYSFAVVVFYGLAVVVDASNVKNYDAISYSVIMAYLPGVVLLCLYPQAIKKFSSIRNLTFSKKMVSLCLFYSVQSIAFYSALSNGGNASQIGPIIQAQVIITVILAIIFLKERDHLLRKFIGAVLVTIGVILLK